MYFNIIKKYINDLKKEDIIRYANKENIKLNDIELDTIYNALKTRFSEIYENGIKVINEYKNRLSEKTYLKLIELYNDTKNKYLK